MSKFYKELENSVSVCDCAYVRACVGACMRACVCMCDGTADRRGLKRGVPESSLFELVVGHVGGSDGLKGLNGVVDCCEVSRQ